MCLPVIDVSKPKSFEKQNMQIEFSIIVGRLSLMKLKYLAVQSYKNDTFVKRCMRRVISNRGKINEYDPFTLTHQTKLFELTICKRQQTRRFLNLDF